MGEIYSLLKKSLEGIAFQCAEIETNKILFSKEVVKMCEVNYCGRYNKTWMCPPAVGKLDDLKAKYTAYNKAFVFTTKHDIEDSLDIEGMFAAGKVHTEMEKNAIKAMEGKDYLILGASSCNICKECTYPNAPCRFPKIAKPSVEAVGINVVDLASQCNINYTNGENTVTYFSVIFYND